MANYIQGKDKFTLCIVALILALLAIPSHALENVTGIIQFQPVKLIKWREGETRTVLWYTNISDVVVDRYEAKMIGKGQVTEATVESLGELMEVLSQDEINVTLIEGDVTYYGEVNVTALFVGLTSLQITLYDQDNNTVAGGELPLSVLLAKQLVNTVFTYMVAVLIAILYFFMGATLDLKIVKGIIKKPIGPVLGTFCQYVIMPGISFALGILFFPDDLNLRLGLFLNGCSPGGGSSNMWTHLLGGSLDLSIMMTCVSTILAFATVPFWVLLVGPVIVSEGNFVIPFGEIIITVVSLIFPCVIGIVLQYFFPKIIPYCEKVLTPFSILILVFIFTVGVYAYLYTFFIMTWKTVLAGLLLPLLGYILGLVLARIFRQNWKNCIAISVETGVQNTTIAIIILSVAIPPPVSNLAAVVPVLNTLFTPLPLIVVLLLKFVYKKTFGRNKVKDATPTDPRDIPADGMITDASDKKPGENALDVQFVNGGVEGGVVNPAADLRDDLS